MNKKIPKKLFKDHYQYWMVRGCSEEDAVDTALKYKGYRSPMSINFYIHKGHSEEDAIKLAIDFRKKYVSREAKIKRFSNEEEYIKNNKLKCSLTKENMLKRMPEEEYIKYKRAIGKTLFGKSPTHVDYWIARGFSEKSAEEKIKEYCKDHSPRCINYWINKTDNYETAVLELSKFQDNSSLSKYILRNGAVFGEKLYIENCIRLKSISMYSVEYWLDKGYSEKAAANKISNIQTNNALKQKQCSSYWVDLGFSKEEAVNIASDIAKKKTCWNICHWMNKGYSKEEAKEIVRKIQSNNGKLAIKSFISKANNRIKYSLLEEMVYNKLCEFGYDVEWHPSIIDTINQKTYFPDFMINDKYYIEVYGDYWHANPIKYNETDFVARGKLAKYIWEHDANRISVIKKLTNKPVFILWESDLRSGKSIEELLIETCK